MAGDPAKTPRPRAWTPLVTAGIVAAATLAFYEFCSIPMTTLGAQKQQRGEAAERIRASARHACDQGLYRDCLRMYDEAKHFDPEGDDDPEVVEGRRQARAGLEARVAQEKAAEAGGE